MLKLSTLLIPLILISCGKKASESKEPVSPRKVVATNSSQNPISLPSSGNKSGCSVDSYTDAQRNLNLSLFLRGNDADEERFFSGLIDGLMIRDVGASIITESHKGESVLMTFTSTDDVITSDVKNLSVPSVIKVCPDAGKYERGSVESAALNATFYISKANRKVKELLPSVKIAPVSVEITPLIKKSLKVIVKGEEVWKYEAFDTDNAYYMPSKNSITFLPHSEEARKAGMSMNFWEVPMVSAHEYGHHIFQSLHPHEAHAEGMKNCFGKMGLQSEASEPQARVVTQEDVLGALNEGFADLISFYTLDNNERGLKGVPCLEISRDVSSPTFANGAPKVFTSVALAEFFSAKESLPAADCSIPDFQSIHILGAVFANGADRFLALSTDTKDQRLSIVLNWLQDMKAKSASMKSLPPEDFLRESFKLLIEMTAAKTDGKIDPSECDIARDIYPGIDGYLPACIPI